MGRAPGRRRGAAAAKRSTTRYAFPMRVTSPVVLSSLVTLAASLACVGEPPTCDTGVMSADGTCVAPDTASPDDTGSVYDTGNTADTGKDTGEDTGTDTGKDTGTDTGTDSGTDTGSDTGTSPTASVYDVQAGGVSGDVTLKGVVVTTGPATDGSIFVQDAGGGEWAGVRVYSGGTFPAVEAGDKVTVVGVAQEYYDETEVIASTITVTGSGSVSVLKLTAPPSDWEPYEGVLVRLQGVALGGTIDSYGQVATDWGIYVDDFLWDYSLDLDPTITYTSITGVMRWSYEEEKVCPRGISDLVR